MQQNTESSTVAQCDRLAFYGDGTGETKQYPVRMGESAPLRFEDKGNEWTLLAIVTPQAGESVDAAILREVRETDAKLAEWRGEAA